MYFNASALKFALLSIGPKKIKMLSSTGNQLSELGISSVQDMELPSGPFQRNVLPRPNMQALDQVTDNIERVVDVTAEQVRQTFENFLNTYTTFPNIDS